VVKNAIRFSAHFAPYVLMIFFSAVIHFRGGPPWASALALTIVSGVLGLHLRLNEIVKGLRKVDHDPDT